MLLSIPQALSLHFIQMAAFSEWALEVARETVFEEVYVGIKHVSE